MPGAAAGDDRVAGLREQLRGLPCRGVVRVGRCDARRAEDRDRACDVAEAVEALDHLARDAQHTPGLAAPEVFLPGGAVEQTLVLERVGIADRVVDPQHGARRAHARAGAAGHTVAFLRAFARGCNRCGLLCSEAPISP